MNQTSAGSLLGWRMVAPGFLAQYLANGLTVGSFGVPTRPLAAELHAWRAMALPGIAVIMLHFTLRGRDLPGGLPQAAGAGLKQGIRAAAPWNG